MSPRRSAAAPPNLVRTCPRAADAELQTLQVRDCLDFLAVPAPFERRVAAGNRNATVVLNSGAASSAPPPLYTRRFLARIHAERNVADRRMPGPCRRSSTSPCGRAPRCQPARHRAPAAGNDFAGGKGTDLKLPSVIPRALRSTRPPKECQGSSASSPSCARKWSLLLGDGRAATAAVPAALQGRPSEKFASLHGSSPMEWLYQGETGRLYSRHPDDRRARAVMAGDGHAFDQN